MALGLSEIQRGAVAILDGDQLVSDPEVLTDNLGPIGARPFVCLQVENGISTWYLLTTQSSPKRLLLDGWKLPGSPVWMRESQYLNDARKPFTGPVNSFVSAGILEIPHQPHCRPAISEAGLAAIEGENLKYRGRG
ncbi:MAG: hypothetical protein KID05_10120 [Pseudomonas sp.]|uniref:hypothetical protein n=1 Tax=Pseudomonas sp. TaxID=306 RepID=UPI0023559B0A|nr:hypothetical protein [Pseudomonas sp.]MBS5839511.1 hypothetical protein [Pseudomonas sp.]